MQKKIRFFTRIKNSVFKFEEYERFLEEPLKKAFGYFFKLLALISLFITIVSIYATNISMKKVATIFKLDFPKFKVEEGTLNIEEKETFEYYFEDYDLKILMNENSTDYNNISDNNIIQILKNSVVIKFNGYTHEIGYNDIGDFSNESIVEFFNTQEWNVLFLNVCLIMFLLNFTIYSLIIFLDIVILSFLGLIINNLIRTKFAYKDLLKISIYAMTLPILLYLLYIMVNTIFGITIKFFHLAYNAISYIYLITVMLMIKADVIKNTQELQMILEEQKKVKKEIERQKEQERQKEKEKEEEEKERKKEKGESSQEPQTDNG